CPPLHLFAARIRLRRRSAVFNLDRIGGLCARQVNGYQGVIDSVGGSATRSGLALEVTLNRPFVNFDSFSNFVFFNNWAADARQFTRSPRRVGCN
ncbi:hypothetical protein CH063_15778, partial [Colletotrichum higginsianum]